MIREVQAEATLLDGAKHGDRTELNFFEVLSVSNIAETDQK